MTMPKFKSKDTMSDEEMAKLLADGANKQSKFFDTGKHDVVIKSVEYRGQAKKDPTWSELLVVFEGTGGKTINAFVAIPTETIFYGENRTEFMFVKAKKFCAALGEDLKKSTWTPVLTKLFAKPEKLAGQGLSISVGYPRAYPEWVGKTPDGNGVRFKLNLGKDRKGNPLGYELENGQPKIFEAPTSKEASQAIQAYCGENNIGFDAFTQVLDYYPKTANAADEVAW